LAFLVFTLNVDASRVLADGTNDGTIGGRLGGGARGSASADWLVVNQGPAGISVPARVSRFQARPKFQKVAVNHW